MIETKQEFKRYNEPLYHADFRPYCSLLCTQRMAKRLIKELNKYRNCVIDLVEKYPDEFFCENWSLAYPNEEQTIFYTINKNEPLENKIKRAKCITPCLKKEKYIYDIGKELTPYDDTLKNFVTKDLKDEIN